MTDLLNELKTLKGRILKADIETRYRFQPRLGALIARLEAQGVAVPEDLRALDEELQAEAVEAQFDNMPV